MAMAFALAITLSAISQKAHSEKPNMPHLHLFSPVTFEPVEDIYMYACSQGANLGTVAGGVVGGVLGAIGGAGIGAIPIAAFGSMIGGGLGCAIGASATGMINEFTTVIETIVNTSVNATVSGLTFLEGTTENYAPLTERQELDEKQVATDDISDKYPNRTNSGITGT